MGAKIMRKVILYIAQSLDGYIARKDGNLDWLPQEISGKMNKFYSEFSQQVDAVLMGRKTYDQIVNVLSPNQWAYPNKTSYVWTSTKIESLYDNVHFMDTDLVTFVKELKEQEGKNIWVLGGGALIAELIKNNLIDEYSIAIVPVILGEGIPLFPQDNKNTVFLKMQECIEENGMIQTRYTIEL